MARQGLNCYAHRAAKEGDTVILRDGLQNADTARIETLNVISGLTYVGDLSVPYNLRISEVHSVKVSRFAIRDLEILQSKNIIIEDCLIRDSKAQKLFPNHRKAALARIENSTSVFIRQSVFADNGSYAIGIQDSRQINLEQNVIVNNWGGGIELSGSGVDEIRMLNNTIVGNIYKPWGYDHEKFIKAQQAWMSSSTEDKRERKFRIDKGTADEEAKNGHGIYLASFTKKTKLILQDNILAFNGAGFIIREQHQAEPLGVQMGHNVFFGNAIIDYGVFTERSDSLSFTGRTGEKEFYKNKNLLADPLLAAPETGDLRLKPDSPVRQQASSGGALGASEAILENYLGLRAASPLPSQELMSFLAQETVEANYLIKLDGSPVDKKEACQRHAVKAEALAKGGLLERIKKLGHFGPITVGQVMEKNQALKAAVETRVLGAQPVSLVTTLSTDGGYCEFSFVFNNTLQKILGERI